MAIEADIGGREAEACGDLGHRRAIRIDPLRRLRQVEFCRERAAVSASHAAGDVADLLLENEADRLRRREFGRTDMGEQRRGSDRRVAGEGQFPPGRKDADRGGIGGIVRRENEDGFGQVELARDRLHAGVGEAVGVQYDRQRIAGKSRVGEHVEREKTSRQAKPPTFRPPLVRAPLRNAATRHGEVVGQPLEAALAHERVVDFRHVRLRTDRIQRVAVEIARARARPQSQIRIRGREP